MNKMREIRESKRMKLRETARRTNLSAPFLCDLEKGRRNAKLSTWEKIANVLGVTVADLTGGELNDLGRETN